MINILVLDDDVKLNQTICTYLNDSGFNAKGCLNANDAYGHTILKLKRDRKIINKMELTRLQRHFEACIQEIEALERTKFTVPSVWAMIIGVIGTAFMAGSVFAIVNEPPIIWLGILLAIPAFIGWIFPYFVYRKLQQTQVQKVQPIIEAKYDEIYEVCEKGHSLL